MQVCHRCYLLLPLVHLVVVHLVHYPALHLVGRNGMHRYNNQDHSMLTAMEAVSCITGTGGSRQALWLVWNTTANGLRTVKIKP